MLKLQQLQMEPVEPDSSKTEMMNLHHRLLPEEAEDTMIRQSSSQMSM